MSRKLIISKLNQNIISALYEDNQMIQVNIDPQEEVSLLGNIYVGKVKNIVKNINAAFIEIANKQMCYLSLAEVKNPVYITKQNSKICIGDEILVQISKEDVKTKAPVCTVNLSFTGKYTVIVHGSGKVGISNKISSDAEKKRLRKIVAPFVREEYGIIVRTNAQDTSDDLIVNEINRLLNEYHMVLSQGIYRNRFSLVSRTPRAYLCAIRDEFAQDIEGIITDDNELYEQIQEYLSLHQQEDLSKLTLYKDPLLPLNKLYSVEHRIEHALREKVWLNSGGTLIIQPTEALTVIDVNTGKAVNKKKNVEETFRKVNLEAAQEIAKQIRLRNLSGIIIVDFIDMESEENKKQLMKTLEEYLKSDPIKTTLVDMTALNLVEITRKKVRKPIYEQIKTISGDNDD